MKNTKKAIIVIACIVIGVIAAVAIILGVAFDEGNTIALKDSEGSSFATAAYDGYDVTYTVNNDYEKEYAATVIEEAKNIFIEKENVKSEDACKYIFKNITEIKTNYKPSVQAAVNKAYEEYEDLTTASCTMAVTDLNGKLVAVFSNGKGEFLSLKKTYAGSTIKPLSVYAPAIESGKYNWSYTVVDEPVKKVKEADGSLTEWPVNSDGKYTGKNVTLADGLAFSTNTVAVRLLQDLGVKESVEILEKNYGINVDFEKNKLQSLGEDEILGNIALGYLYGGVNVTDMAGYYQAFPQGGKYAEPCAIDEILKDEDVIYKSEYSSKEVMSKETAAIMNKMLQRVVSVGTGTGARLKGIMAGGKTGTTSGNADNWFVGYTPEYSCAVYHSNIKDGNICSEVFGSVMGNIEHTEKDFSDKVNIETKLYCEKSGLLRGDKCIYCNKGYYLNSQNSAKCKECK